MEEIYFVTASDGSPVYYLKQYVIDHWDCLEHIKFNTEKILAKDLNIDDVEIFMKDGEEHRLDGPAVISANGQFEFYIEGEFMSMERFYQDPRVIKQVRVEKLRKINKRT